MGEEKQAPAAPQSSEDKLGEALAKLVEADTRAEHERHDGERKLIQARYDALAADSAAEDARHVAALASLRERAVAKLLAAAESIPASAPAAPKAERSKRTKAQMEADGAAIVAKLSPSFGLSVAAIAQATGLDKAIVAPTLRALVDAGRIVKKGEGKGVRYYERIGGAA